MVLESWGLGVAYLAWLIFLVVGVALYHLTGLNAYFFQLRERDASIEAARAQAEDMGQEIFPWVSTAQSLATAARIWKTWMLVGIYFTSFGGFIALTAWLPTYWKSFFEVSAVAAGGLTALYSLTASLIRVVGGGISDRVGGERTALLALVTMIVGSILITSSQTLGLSVVGEVLMAIGMGITNAAVFKLVSQYVNQAVGGAAGWIGGLSAFGGFAIPPVPGAIVRAQGASGYASGFITYIVLGLISLLLAYILRQTHVLSKPGKAAPLPSR